MKKVAIVQSNYIPWKGYFDLVNSVDEFILYDDVQFTRRDWRNRNLIKTPRGLEWMTIPVSVKGRYLQKICETRISEADWGERHWATLVQNYSKAPFFELYRPIFEPLYRRREALLSAVNLGFITAICGILGVATRISWSMDYRPLKEGTTERLVDLCGRAEGTHYLSGPTARDYIDPALFDAAGIVLSYFDYAGYPEYPQSFGKFEHGVTILDLLFNAGPQAPRYMKSFG
ncbi:MAG TPA: WbqC family protein [Burkholderiales bacterium]